MTSQCRGNESIDALPKGNRLLEIYRLLEAGGSYSVSELAERFGVTERTIKDDLLELQGEPHYLALEEDPPQPARWRLHKVRKEST